jgi:hypothetical protein
MERFLSEPAKQLKAALETDVCVIGGSCTGLFAAVRAARLGARVAVVEKQNCFGGVAANALVNVWHGLHDIDNKEQIIAGLTWEMIQRLEKRRAVIYNNNRNIAYRLDTEELKIELDALAVESKLSVFFHTMYTAPYLEDGVLKGIVIENKDGRQVILAKFFIDASGDGDLARDLKLEPYRHEISQPPSPGFKLLGDISGINVNDILQEYGSQYGLSEDWGWSTSIPGCPELSFQANTHVFNVDCSKAADLTHAEMEGRRQIRAVLDTLNRCSPVAVNLHIAAIGSTIGIRDTVHYESDYQCKADELLLGTPFDDAIAYGTYRVDIHHGAGAGITFRSLDGWETVHNNRNSPPVRRRWREDNGYARYYQIPFRTLVQRKIPNFIAAGRMINADAGAFGAIRVMVNLNQLGEAAGVAAYMAINKRKPVWEINTAELRTLLIEGGSASLRNLP